MRVLLRKTENGFYYASPRRWVRDPRAALDFEQVERASRVTRSRRLNGIEIVLNYSDPGLRSRFSLRRDSSCTVGPVPNLSTD